VDHVEMISCIVSLFSAPYSFQSGFLVAKIGKILMESPSLGAPNTDGDG